MINDLVVIDTETSGIDPFENDLLSIAFIPTSPQIPSIEIHVKYSKIVWNKFAKENFKKFESTWINESISPADACDEIEKYLSRYYPSKNVIPIGHNISFDLSFIRKLAHRGKRDHIEGLSHRSIDTHTLLYILHMENLVPKWATTSTGAFEYFNISVDNAARHTAKGDAQATKVLFQKILQMFHQITHKDNSL